MDFGIKKCTTLIMKSGKRQTTEEIELQNHEYLWKRKITSTLKEYKRTLSNKWRWKK